MSVGPGFESSAVGRMRTPSQGHPSMALNVQLTESFAYYISKSRTAGTLKTNKQKRWEHANLLVRSFWKDESVSSLEEWVKSVSVARPSLPTEVLAIPLCSTDTSRVGSEALVVSV